jgi:hypothetical protein
LVRTIWGGAALAAVATTVWVTTWDEADWIAGTAFGLIFGALAAFNHN